MSSSASTANVAGPVALTPNRRFFIVRVSATVEEVGDVRAGELKLSFARTS